ncbi:SdrD B-like domain-containing protein, partial [Staphylococcus hominis]|uniref:SdrD B-like domain-containing protein n=3 Tax=Staphylococcus TaxID=1279 RepID=UPI0028793A16
PSTEEKATTEQPSTEEKATTEQPSTEEKATTEQPSTEEKAATKQPSTEEKATTKQPSTEEKATTKQPSTEEKATTKQSSTEEKATTEQPSTEETTTKPANSKQSELSSNEDKESNINLTDDNKTTNDSVTSDKKAIASKMNEPIVSDDSSVTDKKAYTDDVVSNLNVDTDNKEAITNAVSNDIDLENASQDEINNAIVAEALKTDFTNSDYGFNSPFMTLASLTPKAASTTNATNDSNLGSRAITTFAADTTSGTNVNDKVNATNIAITDNSFDPNNHGSSTLISNFTVNGKVNQGDYFTVKYPENFSIDGDFDYRSKNNIMVTDPLNDFNGNTVATGKYNTTDKTVTYTFTDYVNNKKNISGNIFLPIWTDREKTPDSGDYNVSFNVADETLDTSINVDYTSPIKPKGAVKGDNKPGITSFITKIDKNPNNPTYKQTIIVNPLENRLNDSRVKVYGYNPDKGGRAGSSAVVDRQNTSFKIYRVNDSNKLNDSYYINPDDPNLTDVTTDFDKWIYFNGGNIADIQFGDIDSTYVITVDGHYNPNSTNPIRTRVEALNRIAEGSANRINYTFDNENIIRTTGGSANGEDIQRYNLGDYVWEDTNQNGLQDSNENGISGVTVTLKDVDGNILTTTTTDDAGKYQFTNLINGTYKVEFETPAGFTPTDANVNNDTADESDSDGLSAIGVINDADNLTIDSGFYKQPAEKYQVGDRVWYDTNKNGIQDEGENGIGGVTVLLKKDNRTIANTVTDNAGKYGFYDLEKGQYTIEFIKPDNYHVSPQNAGNREVDSDGLVVSVDLQSNDDSYDLGLYKAIDNGYEITVEDVSYKNVVRENQNLTKNTIQLVQQGEDGRDRVFYKELGYNPDLTGIDDSKLLEEDGYYWQEVRRDNLYSPQDAIIEYNLDNNEGVTNITYNPTTNQFKVEYSDREPEYIDGPNPKDGKDGKDGQSVTTVTERGTQGDQTGSYIRTYYINADGSRGDLISESFVADGKDGEDGANGKDGKDG